MASAKSFRDLKVYQAAQEAAVRIFELSKRFSREEQYSLTDQIRRSSRAVKAIIAEAWARRRYKAAFINKIDEALGESSDLRPHSPGLQAAVAGLFAALSGWRTAAVHLERLPRDQGRREADIVLGNIPQELRSVPAQGEASDWAVDPSSGRKACAAAVRTLTSLPADTPSLRLLADRTADAQGAQPRPVALQPPARAVQGQSDQVRRGRHDLVVRAVHGRRQGRAVLFRPSRFVVLPGVVRGVIDPPIAGGPRSMRWHAGHRIGLATPEAG